MSIANKIKAPVKSTIQDIERIKMIVPYVGQLIDHPFVQLIEGTLLAMGFDNPVDCRHADDNDHLGWSVSFDERVVARYELSLTPEREFFFEATCAIGTVPEDSGKRLQLLDRMIYQNRNLAFPCWLAVDCQGTLMAVFRCNAQLISTDLLIARVYGIGGFASGLNGELVQGGLVQPLHKSYFRIYGLK